MSPRVDRVLALSAALAATLASGPSLAFPPDEPLPGIHFQANQAFVGDPLLGMEPGEAGALYTFQPDDAEHMASTTKSFTLLLAVEAVEGGWVDLDDWVTISEKAAEIDANHSGSGQNTHSEQGFVTGEQVRFEDLLYAMMHSSAGDASIAIAQHVAVAYDPTLADESDAEQEQAFTNRMNARAAELGLADTIFFNAYGGDHVHMNDNTPGPDTDHSASPRDMARWFDVGMQMPLYREIAGFQGTWNMTTFAPPGFWSNDSTTGSGSYPGQTGGKGGSGGGCGTCGIASARRLGRELIEAFTQGAGGDGTTLLDYGFASLFHPTLEAASAPWTGGFVTEDLACLTSSVAASAVTGGSGPADVLVWSVDVDGGSIEHANPIVVNVDPVGGITGTRPRSDDDDAVAFLAATQLTTDAGDDPEIATFVAPVVPGSDDPRKTDDYAARDGGDEGKGGAPFLPDLDEKLDGAGEAHASAARAVGVGGGRIAVIEETDQGVILRLHGIDGDLDPFPMSWAWVGEGTQARLVRIDLPSGTYVVTGHRRPDGANELRAYPLEPVAGAPGWLSIGNVIDTRTFPATQGFELADLGGASGRFVAAYQQIGGGRGVRSFDLDPIGGDLAQLDAWSFGATSTQVTATRVAGYPGRTILALGFLNGNGEPALEVLEVDGSGDLTSRGKAASDRELDPTERVRIAAHREGGVLLAYQDGLSQYLEVWALDADNGGGSAITPDRLTTEFAGQQGLHGLCRVPGNAAEGDFLLSHGAPGADPLRVQAWRSAPR